MGEVYSQPSQSARWAARARSRPWRV